MMGLKAREQSPYVFTSQRTEHLTKASYITGSGTSKRRSELTNENLSKV